MNALLVKDETTLYHCVGRGMTAREIMAYFNHSYSLPTIEDAIRQILTREKISRVGLILAYANPDHPDTQFTYKEYQSAALLIDSLHPVEREVVSVLFRQWMDWCKSGTGKRPTLQTVADETGHDVRGINSSLGRANRIIGGRLKNWKLIQLYYMAMIFSHSLDPGRHKRFPFPPGLTKHERRIYFALCQGASNREINIQLGRQKLWGVATVVSGITAKLGQSRTEIALRFVDQYPHLLSKRAYAKARQKIALLAPPYRLLLAEYAEQWQHYLKNPTGEPPDRIGLAKAGGVKLKTINRKISDISKILCLPSNLRQEVRDCRLLMWYEMYRLTQPAQTIEAEGG